MLKTQHRARKAIFEVSTAPFCSGCGSLYGAWGTENRVHRTQSSSQDSRDADACGLLLTNRIFTITDALAFARLARHVDSALRSLSTSLARSPDGRSRKAVSRSSDLILRSRIFTITWARHPVHSPLRDPAREVCGPRLAPRATNSCSVPPGAVTGHPPRHGVVGEFLAGVRGA